MRSARGGVEASPRDVMRYAACTALAASWRVMLSASLVTILPLAFAAACLLVAGLPPASVWQAYAAAACFPLSFFVHEFGHALTSVVLVRRAGRDDAMFGTGGFTGGAVVRWAADPETDAVVSLVGPLLGAAMAGTALLPGTGFLLGFPLTLLYLLHLGSLLPTQSDGRLVADFIRTSRKSDSGAPTAVSRPSPWSAQGERA